MIRLFGNPQTLCDGVIRRDLLHLGGLSLFGLNLASFSRLQAAQTGASHAGSFGRAKSCILVYLVGAPPQHETFDPKPDAPAAIQGELKAIPSAVSGVPIGELLPRFAQITDRLTIVRSMTHAWPHAPVEQSPRRRPRALVAGLFGVPGGGGSGSRSGGRRERQDWRRRQVESPPSERHPRVGVSLVGDRSAYNGPRSVGPAGGCCRKRRGASRALRLSSGFKTGS